MTREIPEPTSKDWACLCQGLEEMRDALVATAIALRDQQLTLNSHARYAARLQADQLIARTQTRDYLAGGARDNGCKPV